MKDHNEIIPLLHTRKRSLCGVIDGAGRDQNGADDQRSAVSTGAASMASMNCLVATWRETISILSIACLLIVVCACSI
jgi:hypothetical protein